MDKSKFVPAFIVLAAITYGYLLGAEQLPIMGAGKTGAYTAVQGEGVPSGAILMTLTTCPTGYSEVSSLNGKTLVGTLAANGNVGGTGGADTLTPAGTNSAPALTMNAYTPAGTNSGGAVSAHAGTAVAAHADHTHTYTQVPNHVHPYASQTATTGSVSSYEHGAIDTSSTAAEATITTNNPTGGVATATTNGASASLTHSVTQPSDHAFTQPTFSGTPATLTGSVAAPVFTGTQFDNRSAFVRMIFCVKS